MAATPITGGNPYLQTDCYSLGPPTEHPEPTPNVADIDFLHATPFIEAALAKSREAREVKLGELPPNIAEQLRGFEAALEDVQRIAVERLVLEKKVAALFQRELEEMSSGSSHSSDLDPEAAISDSNYVNSLSEGKQKSAGLSASFESSITIFNAQIKGYIALYQSMFPSINIENDWFSDYGLLDRVSKEKLDISLQFIKEQILNRCINKYFFHEKVRRILEESKEKVVAEFCPRELSPVNLADVTFNLIPRSGESHPRGKSAIKVEFKLLDAPLFSIYFKPRDAQIDKKIIDVFAALNALPETDKSSPVALPTLKIRNYAEEGTPPYSLWACVEGMQFEGNTAEEAIQRRPLNERSRLLSQLLRLESVCVYLSLSDLHLENVIFSRLGQADSQIYLIDLESVQPGKGTGLRDGSSGEMAPSLTGEEVRVLEEFKKSLSTVFVRFVPVQTTEFLGALQQCDSFVGLTESVLDSINLNSLGLVIDIKELKKLLLTDFLHNDVPYLTTIEDRLYYMREEDPILIARKK